MRIKTTSISIEKLKYLLPFDVKIGDRDAIIAKYITLNFVVLSWDYRPHESLGLAIGSEYTV